jgi:hypothetical protein
MERIYTGAVSGYPLVEIDRSRERGIFSSSYRPTATDMTSDRDFPAA